MTLSRSPPEALGCLVFYAAFGLALLGPPWALVHGPAWGLASAGLSLAAWLRWGPPAMPGLVPGLMLVTVAASDLVVAGVAVVRLSTQLGRAW